MLGLLLAFEGAGLELACGATMAEQRSGKD
jgi:hypothetical protein